MPTAAAWVGQICSHWSCVCPVVRADGAPDPSWAPVSDWQPRLVPSTGRKFTEPELAVCFLVNSNPYSRRVVLATVALHL